MLSKFRVLKNVFLGYIYKWLVDCHILGIPSLSITNKAEGRLIVSLTSYGRRVRTSIVYYSIVSILRQSVRPDRIILCLDETIWNDGTIPRKLFRLKKYGVEFLYCKDLRSYTKLVPCLKKFANDYIITIDDDVIYTKDTIQRLVDASKVNPRAICCLNASKPIIKDGYAFKYEDWKQYKTSLTDINLIFPCGVGGILYPPHSLDPMVINDSIFLELCPYADDVWFWFCGMLKQTPKHVINKNGVDYSFDVLYQYFNKGSALTHANRYEHQNDRQIRTIFDYFKCRLDDKGNLIQNVLS